MNKIFRKIAKLVNPVKSVAVITVVCFLISSLLSSAPAYGAIMPAVQMPAVSADITNDIIPFNVGRITDALYSAKGSSIVINIQDLHSHEETQRNINTILEILNKKYGLDKVYVEGAWGSVNTKWLSGIKDENIKKQIIENMLKSGRLTGSEYFAAENGLDTVLEGIEEKEIYTQNLRRLKEIYENKQQIQSYIPNIKYILNKKAEIYYSYQNKKINRIIQKYEQKRISGQKYFAYLIKTSVKSGIDLRNYKEIIKFAKVLKYQGKINSGSVNKRISELLNELKSEISYKDYKKLIDKIGNKATESEFYSDLFSIVESKGLLKKWKYRDLAVFFEYLKLAQSVNPIELTYEEKNLTRQLHEKNALTVFEREIYFLKEYVGYMQGYLENKLTSDEYDKFTSQREKFNLLWKKYIDIDGIINFDKYFGLFEDFYKQNVERNRYFIKNVIGVMPEKQKQGVRIKADIDHQKKVFEQIKDKKDIKVLITGGFHTYGVTKLLEDEGVSYIVVTPNVTESAATAEQKYEQIFTQQSGILYETLQKMFVSQLGKGAVVNADVLTVKGLTISVLNQMLETLGAKERIAGISVKEEGAEVIFDNGGKEVIDLTQQQTLADKEKATISEYQDTFTAFNEIQNAFRQLREARRAGKTVSIDFNRIKKLVKDNNPMKSRFEQEIANLQEEYNKKIIDKKFILIGAPGSGKGTFSQEFMKKYLTKQISSGDVLREVVKTNPEVKAIMDSGQLVSDDMVIGLMKAKMLEVVESGIDSFILDGFPRTVYQAEQLQKFFAEQGWDADVIFIDIDLNTIQKRLSGRRVCPTCREIVNTNDNNLKQDEKGNYLCPKDGSILIQRDDDKPETISKRYETFMQKTLPLVHWYKGRGVSVDTESGETSEIFKRVDERISKQKGSSAEISSEFSNVWSSIETLAKDYPELIAQTKIDIQRMIETDAFLSQNEKNLPAPEKAKLVESKILILLLQLEKYLKGDLTGIPSSKEKEVEFGTAGNRGEMLVKFDFNNVALIAQALANKINADSDMPKAVFLGNDTRFLGKWFSIVMERVLTANKIQVYTVKEKIAAPTISCYVKEAMPGKFAATLNVTASHNPKEHNGVKLNFGDGAPAVEEFTDKIAAEIKQIQDRVNGKSVKIASKENSIIVTDAELKHLEYVINKLNNLAGLNDAGSLGLFKQKAARIGIVLDGKNTALMPVLKELFKYYGFTNVIIINENRDVAFGGVVNPEPKKENTEELSDMVEKGKALFKEKGMDVDFSFGLATDPDGDRFCVKDIGGNHMTPDEIGVIDTYELLENIIAQMKAKRDAGQLTLSEIKKFEGVMVRSMVTTFALDKLAEIYSKEFMDIAFGDDNTAISAEIKSEYRTKYEKKEYIPFSVVITAVGWKNIADAQKSIEKSGKKFLIGVESSGGISIGLYDKDGAPATMMPILFAVNRQESLAQLLEKVEKKIGFKVHSIELSIKFNEIAEVIELAKKELNETDERYENTDLEKIVREIANKRQKTLIEWITLADTAEITELIYRLGMPKELKVINIVKIPQQGMQIQLAGPDYKEGDLIKTLLTLRASGTEPLFRVFTYTDNKNLTKQISDIGDAIVKGAFKQDSTSAKLETSGIWLYLSTRPWVKVLSFIMNPKKDYLRDSKVRNMAVAIAETFQSSGSEARLERFINRHANPESVREAATDLNRYTTKVFKITALAFLPYIAFGIYGIGVTILTGGLPLLTAIYWTVLFGVQPFIISTIANILRHNKHNNLVDQENIDLLSQYLMNNPQAVRYLKKELVEYIGRYYDVENFGMRIRNADKKELAQFLLENKLVLQNLSEVLDEDINECLADFGDLSVNLYVGVNQRARNNVQTVRLWLIFSAGLSPEAVDILFKDPQGTGIIRGFADRAQVIRAQELMKTDDNVQVSQQDRLAYSMSRFMRVSNNVSFRYTGQIAEQRAFGRYDYVSKGEQISSLLKQFINQGAGVYGRQRAAEVIVSNLLTNSGAVSFVKERLIAAASNTREDPINYFTRIESADDFELSRMLANNPQVLTEIADLLQLNIRNAISDVEDSECSSVMSYARDFGTSPIASRNVEVLKAWLMICAGLSAEDVDMLFSSGSGFFVIKGFADKSQVKRAYGLMDYYAEKKLGKKLIKSKEDAQAYLMNMLMRKPRENIFEYYDTDYVRKNGQIIYSLNKTVYNDKLETSNTAAGQMQLVESALKIMGFKVVEGYDLKGFVSGKVPVSKWFSYARWARETAEKLIADYPSSFKKIKDNTISGAKLDGVDQEILEEIAQFRLEVIDRYLRKENIRFVFDDYGDRRDNLDELGLDLKRFIIDQEFIPGESLGDWAKRATFNLKCEAIKDFLEKHGLKIDNNDLESFVRGIEKGKEWEELTVWRAVKSLDLLIKEISQELVKLGFVGNINAGSIHFYIAEEKTGYYSLAFKDSGLYHRLNGSGVLLKDLAKAYAEKIFEEFKPVQSVESALKIMGFKVVDGYDLKDFVSGKLPVSKGISYAQWAREIADELIKDNPSRLERIRDNATRGAKLDGFDQGILENIFEFRLDYLKRYWETNLRTAGYGKRSINLNNLEFDLKNFIINQEIIPGESLNDWAKRALFNLKCEAIKDFLEKHGLKINNNDLESFVRAIPEMGETYLNKWRAFMSRELIKKLVSQELVKLGFAGNMGSIYLYMEEDWMKGTYTLLPYGIFGGRLNGSGMLLKDAAKDYAEKIFEKLKAEQSVSGDKLEISGVWDSVKNSLWVKILSFIINPGGNLIKAAKARNMAVAISESSQSSGSAKELENFINAHDDPDAVRKAATELNKYTAKTFKITFFAFLPFMLWGIYGITATIFTGGWPLAAALYWTVLFTVQPFIIKKIANIRWHYKYNNGIDIRKAYLIKQGFLRNQLGISVARNLIIEHKAKEKGFYSSSINGTDEMAYMLMDNPIIFNKLKSLATSNLVEAVSQIEQFARTQGFDDSKTLMDLWKIIRNADPSVRENFEIIRVWLSINIGLSLESIYNIFNYPDGKTIVKNFATNYLAKNTFEIIKEIEQLDSKLETGKTTQQENIAKGVKNIYSLPEEEKQQIINDISNKYPNFALRFVGSKDNPYTLGLKIGVFYEINFDGQLYQNANEPDKAPVDSYKQIPKEVKEILSYIAGYAADAQKDLKSADVNIEQNNNIANALKKIYSLPQGQRDQIINAISNKYPNFALRFVGSKDKPDTLGLKIGVFYEINFDGQLYQNANEPDKVLVREQESVNENIEIILSEIIEYAGQQSATDNIGTNDSEKPLDLETEIGVKYANGDIKTEPITEPVSPTTREDVFDIGSLSQDRQLELERKGIEALLDGKVVLSMLMAGASSRMNVQEAPAELKAKVKSMQSKAAVPVDEYKGVIITYFGVFGVNIARLFDQIEAEARRVGVNNPERIWDNVISLLTNDEYIAEHQQMLNENNYYGLKNRDKVRLFKQPLGAKYNAVVGDVRKMKSKFKTEAEYYQTLMYAAQIAEEAKNNPEKVVYAGGLNSKGEFVTERDPLGHGEYFHQMVYSGELGYFIDNGMKYFFVKNVDNYAAKFDKTFLMELGLFIERKLDWQSEVSERTPGMKGGSWFKKTAKGNSQFSMEDPTIKATQDAGYDIGDKPSFAFNNGVGFGTINYVINLYKKDGQTVSDFIKEYKSALAEKEKGNIQPIEQIAQRGRAKFPKLIDPKPAKNITEYTVPNDVEKYGDLLTEEEIKKISQYSGKTFDIHPIVAKIETNMWQSTGVSDENVVSTVEAKSGRNIDIRAYLKMDWEDKKKILEQLRFLATKSWDKTDEEKKQVVDAMNKISGAKEGEDGYISGIDDPRVVIGLETYQANKIISDDLLRYITEEKLITDGVLETLPDSFASVAVQNFMKVLFGFVKNLQMSSLFFLFKDTAFYTIIADSADEARILTAQMLASKGIKVNLILLGSSGLIKETQERIEHNGKLAYGLIDKKGNLTVYGGQKIDEMDENEMLEAIIKSIKFMDKSDIKILDITLSDYDRLSEADTISDMVVKPGASATELFTEALKQKAGKYKEHVLQFAGLSQNIPEQDIDEYDSVNIQTAKQRGLMSINISVSDAVLAEKSEKLKQIIETAHKEGLKVVFAYKIDIHRKGMDDFLKFTGSLIKTFEEYKIDGINLDLSESGNLASTIHMLMALTTLQNRIKNLAVKMPSEILESEYKGVFREHSISRIVDYRNIKNIRDRRNIIVDVTIDKQSNSIFDTKELMDMFVNNNITMVSFDRGIIEALDSANEDFTFAGLKNMADLLNAIFNTTPEGQYVKGVIKGRSIKISDKQADELFEFKKSGINMAEKIKEYLPEEIKDKQYSRQEAEGIVEGMLEEKQMQQFGGENIIFADRQYADMFKETLVRYRTITGNSYTAQDKNIEEVLSQIKNNNKIEEVKNLLINGQSAANTELIGINILSSMLEDEDLTMSDKTAVLEGLLTMLLATTRQIENIKISENMKVEDINAILRAA